jgi:plasmid stabilization system protein ParE
VPRYFLTASAVRDLDLIKEQLLDSGGKRVARYVFVQFREAFLFLGNNPQAGHRREDLTAAQLKFWSVFSYLIIYDPATQPVEILNVVHGSRDVVVFLERNIPGKSESH